MGSFSNLILHHPVNIQEKYNGAAYLYAFGNIYHSHSIIFANLTFFHSFCTALADIIQDLLFPLFFNAYHQCDIFLIQIQSLCTKLAASAPEGAELLGRLVERAGDSVEILVGAGVTAQNIPALAAQTGAHAFHLSGKQVLQSRMTFRREGVPMGLPGFSEFEVWQTDEENIRAARQALDAIKNN